MSVAYDDEPWNCEECGLAIHGPAVVRMGTLELRWHPACALAAATALIQDVREAALAGDPRPHWRRRQLAGVRYRLKAAEWVA